MRYHRVATLIALAAGCISPTWAENATELIAKGSESVLVDPSNASLRSVGIAGAALKSSGLVRYGAITPDAHLSPEGVNSLLFGVSAAGLDQAAYSSLIERVAFRRQNKRDDVIKCAAQNKDCCASNPDIGCAARSISAIPSLFSELARAAFLRDLVAIEAQSIAGFYLNNRAPDTLVANATVILAIDPPTRVERRSLLLRMELDRIQAILWLVAKLHDDSSIDADAGAGTQIECESGTLKRSAFSVGSPWKHAMPTEAKFFASDVTLPALVVAQSQNGLLLALRTSEQQRNAPILDTTSSEFIAALGSCLGGTEVKEQLPTVMSDDYSARALLLTIVAAGVMK